MAYSYMEVIVNIASLAGLERPYEEYDHNTWTRKQLLCPKMKVINCTNFMIDHLINKKKMEKMENCCFCNFLYVTVVVYFMSFESTVRHKTIKPVIEMDMYLKKLRTTAFGSFKPLCLYRANGHPYI